jgi:hypothetical protein
VYSRRRSSKNSVIVDLLLDNGADISAHEDVRQCAAGRIVKWSCVLLLEKGADGAQAFAPGTATSRDHDVVIELLLEQGWS